MFLSVYHCISFRYVEMIFCHAVGEKLRGASEVLNKMLVNLLHIYHIQYERWRDYISFPRDKCVKQSNANLQ